MLSAVLFAIGTAGVFLRRNLITILLSIEIMLNAVNLTFVAVGPLSRHGRRADHHVLRHDGRGRRGRRRPGARHRALPAPRDAQSRRVHVAEVVRHTAASPSIPLAAVRRASSINALRSGERLPKSDLRAALACAGDARRRSRVSVMPVLGMLAGAAPSARSTQTLFTLDRVGRSADSAARSALDPLSSLMILVVTGIGSLIHIYSTGLHARGDATASTRATSRT